MKVRGAYGDVAVHVQHAVGPLEGEQAIGLGVASLFKVGLVDLLAAKVAQQRVGSESE